MTVLVNPSGRFPSHNHRPLIWTPERFQECCCDESSESSSESIEPTSSSSSSSSDGLIPGDCCVGGIPPFAVMTPANFRDSADPPGHVDYCPNCPAWFNRSFYLPYRPECSSKCVCVWLLWIDNGADLRCCQRPGYGGAIMIRRYLMLRVRAQRSVDANTGECCGRVSVSSSFNWSQLPPNPLYPCGYGTDPVFRWTPIPFYIESGVCWGDNVSTSAVDQGWNCDKAPLGGNLACAERTFMETMTISFALSAP